MGYQNQEWLPHIDNSMPTEAQGSKVSSYAIALEGWRRGLTLKYIDRNRNIFQYLYSLSDQKNEHVFAGARGDLVTREAIRICNNKHLSKQYFQKSNVPTPEGEAFDNNSTDEQIINYAERLGFPLVIKPVSGSGGSGVIADINAKEEFITALNYVKYDLKYTDLIVEKFFSGVDYRVYVIGDQVVAAFDRIPANVIGDGTHTIDELIKIKIKERQKNPALYNRPIKIDGEVHNLLKSKDYTLQTIPKNGERVFLKTKNNISSGGDSRDVTDELSNELENIVINATKAIPGLVQAGVDIIVDQKRNTGVILEINSRPSIRNHLFPMEGKARDIPKAIIDYYFPATKGHLISSQYYFDLKSVHDTFRKGLAKEFVVFKIPTGNINTVIIEVNGLFNSKKYGKWIRKNALSFGLNGYFSYSKNNKAILVISGSNVAISKLRNVISNGSSEKENLVITSSYESKSNLAIKMGFEIIKRN